MTDTVLTIQEVVRLGRRYINFIDVVSSVVRFTTNIKVVTVHFAVLVHHWLDHTSKTESDLVALALFAPEIYDFLEVVRFEGISLDQGGLTTSPLLWFLRHGAFAGKFETITVERGPRLLFIFRLDEGRAGEHGAEQRDA